MRIFTLQNKNIRFYMIENVFLQICEKKKKTEMKNKTFWKKFWVKKILNNCCWLFFKLTPTFGKAFCFEIFFRDFKHIYKRN